MVFKTFDDELNLILSGNKPEISLFYGAAGTGKTTFCYLAVIENVNKGKVIFIDTEDGFSLERFNQLVGNNFKETLDKILIFKINSFKDQQLKIKKLLDIIKKTNVSLIIVDTMGSYYRRMVKSKPDLANKMLNSQLRILKYISKKIPVVITSQVYQDIENNMISLVGKKILDRYYKNLIKLEKKPSRILYCKDLKLEFEINDEGINFI